MIPITVNDTADKQGRFDAVGKAGATKRSGQAATGISMSLRLLVIRV